LRRKRGKWTRLSLDISGDLFAALQREYKHVGRLSNPRPPRWSDFVAFALCLGLERLKTMSDAEALVLLESRPGGR